MPCKHHILCCPLLLLPSVFPSIRVFSNGSALHIRWPKYWSFSFTSVLPMNIQGWLPLWLIGLISLLSQVFSRVFYNTTIQKHQYFAPSLLYGPTFTSVHDYGKTIALIRQTFVSKVMFLFFNMLSRFVIAFLPRSKCLLISWQQLLSAAILQTSVPSPKGKVCPSEGCLGYWLWWCLLSLGGMENSRGAKYCQDQPTSHQGRSHTWVYSLTPVHGGGGHAGLCKSDTVVAPLPCSPNLLHRPIYREIMYWLYELKYSFFFEINFYSSLLIVAL